MSDENPARPEPNWADYIDGLQVFDPPTPRLARKQRQLDDSRSNAPHAMGAAAPWWHPPGPDKPRR